MILLILLVALTLYAVLGGADFGAGVWEFNTALRASDRERNLLYKAIGPVWETNHVWLIFVLVLLFGAYPPAFASLNQALFLPLLLALIGIVFRGAAYAFRSQLKANSELQVRNRVWIAAFALASVLSPLFLGAAVGAIASGRLSFDKTGNFTGSVVTGWINELSIFVAFFYVGLCAYAAAVYMVRESKLAGMDDLQLIWRKRSLVVGSIMGVLALGGLVLLASRFQPLWDGMKQNGWPAILISFLAGVLSLWTIYKNQVHASVVAVSVTCAAVVIGWGLAQYPYVLPPVWTASDAASPDSVMRLILQATAVGSAFLVPALILLFKIFKSSGPPN